MTRNVRLAAVAAAIFPALSLAASAQQLPATSPVAEISRALRANHFEAALHQSQAALRQAPNDPRLWSLEALSLQGLHQDSKAMASFQKALTVAPDFLPALQGAAQLGYSTHDAHTNSILHHLLQLNPTDQVAHAMLAETLFTEGDCAGAITQFEQAPELINNRPEMLLHQSACLVQQSKFAEAAAIFQQILQAHPEASDVRYDLALAQFRAGQKSEAQASLAPLLQLATPSEDALTLGAEIAEAQGSTQAALDLLHQAIQLHPRDKAAYLDFAFLAYQHASLQVGLDVVKLGLQQMPDAAELYFARGVLLCQLGHIDEGFADFQHANQLDPRLSFVGVAEGIAKSQAHDAPAALAHFRAEVRQHPNDALAWYLLAEALAQAGPAQGTPAFAEALNAAKTAARLNPTQPDAQDLLASIYLQANNVQGAIAASHAALAINPQDPQALYHLVLAIRKTDQRDELPGLVRRLVEARHNADANLERNRPRVLVESNPAPAPIH